jgi:hypothetical protein
MWIQFAPPVVQWVTFGCLVVVCLLVMAMPKHERAELFRQMRNVRRRRPTSTPPDPAPSFDREEPNAAGRPRDLWLEDAGPSRSTNPISVAVQILVVVSAAAVLALFMWMAIAFVTNVPGWR